MIKVSVVLPTYNRIERLKSVLKALENQSYPIEAFEVLVVSDGSTDGTNKYLANLETPLILLPIDQQNQGPAAARNNGVAKASGEYILFIDDDVVPIPTFIDEHMKVHQGNGSQVVIGPMITPDNYEMSPWVNYEQTMLVKQYQAMENGDWAPTARQFYTGNTSLKRKHIIEVGGFDPAFRRAEDLELAYRLNDKGLHFAFNSQAVGFHFAERSFESWSTIAYTYGRNDVIFNTQKGQQWLLPQVFREFLQRHLFIQILTWLLLDRPRLSHLLIAQMKSNVERAYSRNKHRLAIMLCSGIYNLKYYQGISDELGGRKAFFRALRQAVKFN
ncbi:MAG: glycosyltransferase family 2 protein [Anaerolineaceae bacterium]|nr:glycosyltransferase family 2 protein [Anaerolineaceae bacterium]